MRLLSTLQAAMGIISVVQEQRFQLFTETAVAYCSPWREAHICTPATSTGYMTATRLCGLLM